MIKVEYRAKLQGAEKYGSCASREKKRDVYKISFGELNDNHTSISLCGNCFIRK